MNTLRYGQPVTLMDTNCHRANPPAASWQCHPEANVTFPASRWLSEEEVMRLRCVNLRSAYRMLQLPKVYLLDVNHERTRMYINTHTRHVYTLSSASCHFCIVMYRTC